ncbi:MAG TPA: ABC transporter ATP-binding protein [Pseudonocardiaceae bacterium]
MTAVLTAQHLTKNFPVRGRFALRRSTVHAVQDVTIGLSAGKVTAVVGESGSGKSTLARMLARLISPTSGEVLLNGDPVPRGAANRAYRREVQLVLQDPFSSLNPIHSIRYHLSRPLRIHGFAADTDAISELLHRVALTPAERFIDKFPHELSGGQRQRVAIARALAVRPEVLIADEPVSMLDVSIRLGILNVLADLRDNEDLAILYVTHDIASARYLADAIVVMYAGQIVEAGPARQVTDAPAHPYTQLLLRAAPDPDRTEPVTDLAGRGAPPSLIRPPSGCRFHPRCPHAMDICRTKAPQPLPINADHTASCWLYQEKHHPTE